MNPGELLIRADASGAIGSGHMMRCLALAQMWRDQGGKVTFLSRCDSEAMRNRLEREGLQFVPVKEPHPSPSDLRITLGVLVDRVLGQEGSCWMVLDGHHFDTDYQAAVRETGCCLMVIDDMAHFTRYHAHVILNHGVHAESLHYACDQDTKLLLGTKYALLRGEFVARRGWKREMPDIARRILVTMGGADSKGMTAKALRAIGRSGVEDLEVAVVVGPNNSNVAETHEVLRRMPYASELFNSPEDMPGLMAWADLAVCGGGGTGLETAFMGLPSLMMVLSENQRSMASGLAEKQCSVTLGNSMETSVEDLAGALRNLIVQREAREKMSRAGRELVDGAGTDRVIGQLLMARGEKRTER